MKGLMGACMRMKIGIVRGPILNPWEMQSYEKLKNYGILPIGIATYNHYFDISKISFPVRKTHSIGSMVKGASLISRITKNILSYDLSSILDMFLLNFDEIVNDLDMLHSADIFYLFSYQSVKSGKPTIITEWENLPSSRRMGLRSKFTRKFRDYVVENASHFIAVTEKAKNALEIEGVNPEKISVIPGGIDVAKFRPTKKDENLLRKFNVPQDAIVILFVGRLVWEKGIVDLIYAIREILRKDENVYLLIVGSGPLKDDILKLSQKLGLLINIRFLGPLKYQEMPKIYSTADIFCLPSIPTEYWQEQFGYSLVEAMACGKPVISTLSGSIPEVVKDGKSGILIQPTKGAELVRALNTLISNETKRRKMGRNAREWVLKKFDANKIADKTIKVYKEVVE
jgi:glycosyltransferase involved in cell wall biosynthesis